MRLRKKEDLSLQIGKTSDNQRPNSPGAESLSSKLKTEWSENFGGDSVTLQIPFQFRNKQFDIKGHTQNIGSDCLRLFSSTPIGRGTPLSLKFSLGEDTCYVNVSGRVLFCRTLRGSGEKQFEVVIKFSAVRGWEKSILHSAIRVLKENLSTSQEPLLTIHVEEDVLAQEAANLADSSIEKPSEGLRDEIKAENKFTPHPGWVLELKKHVDPYWKAVTNCRLIQEASAGTLPLKQMRAWIVQLYPFIETFPKWIAMNISKTRDPISLGFLIDNIRVEKRHAIQWVHMAKGFGIPRTELYTVQPLPEVDALTHWLWSINSQGTLAEAIAATSFAIEGVTQDIAKITVKGFPHYEGVEGVHLDRKAYWWMESHAKYDDIHPLQALEIMKHYTDTTELQEKVTFAAQRSLEYLFMALENCYLQFHPRTAEITKQKHSSRVLGKDCPKKILGLSPN